MERMKQLQECRDEEEASQEEMATRFEREKTESMLVATAGNATPPPPPHAKNSIPSIHNNILVHSIPL